MIKTTFISMAPAAWVQFTAEQHLVSVTCGEKHVNIWKPAAEFDLFLMLMYSKEHFDSAGFFHHSLLTEKILPSCFVPDWLLSLIFGRVCVGSVGSWSRSIQASPSTAGGTGWGQRYFLFVNANTSVWGTRFTSLVLICSYCHCISVESGAVWPGAAHQHVLLQHHWQTLSYTSVHELWSVRWQYWRLPPSRVKEHVHRSIGVFFFLLSSLAISTHWMFLSSLFNSKSKVGRSAAGVGQGWLPGKEGICGGSCTSAGTHPCPFTKPAKWGWWLPQSDSNTDTDPWTRQRKRTTGFFSVLWCQFTEQRLSGEFRSILLFINFSTDIQPWTKTMTI